MTATTKRKREALNEIDDTLSNSVFKVELRLVIEKILNEWPFRATHVSFLPEYRNREKDTVSRLCYRWISLISVAMKFSALGYFGQAHLWWQLEQQAPPLGADRLKNNRQTLRRLFSRIMYIAQMQFKLENAPNEIYTFSQLLHKHAVPLMTATAFSGNLHQFSNKFKEHLRSSNIPVCEIVFD